MKLLTIILLFAALTVQGQGVKNYLKHNAVSLSCMTVAGAMDGWNEVLEYDYPAFKTAFPNANDQFWGPESWTNKWKNGNPDEGPSFPGSTTILVWTTDGYHLTKSLNKAFICGALTFKICNGKQKWYIYLIDFAAHSLAYSIGFNLTLHIIFKHPY